MRIVDSTASKVTASMAARKAMWIVTSTTRSSSLASIMRTGGNGPPAAASDCSISVCPGKGTPAAASASLWMGAVTMAAASPACTQRTACSMQRAAAAPQRASMRPQGSPARPSGSPGGAITGRQPGGTSSSSATRSITAVIGAAGAAQHGRVAHDGGTGQPAAPEGLDDDLRADAHRIAHGHQQGLHAGFAMSMNMCSSPNCRATSAATAGAP